MKTLLVLLLVCSWYELQAQAATTPQSITITFDYASRTYVPADYDCFKKGATISYRIININTFAKKVLINGSLLSLNTSMPTEISTLFRIKADNADDKLKSTQEQVDKMEKVKGDTDKKVTEAATIPTPNNAAINAKTKLTVAAKEADSLVEYCEDYYSEAVEIRSVLVIPQRMAEIMADGSIDDEKKMEAALDKRGINDSLITLLKANLKRFMAAYEKAYDQYEVASTAAREAKNEGEEAKIKSAQEQIQKDYESLKKQYEEAIESITDLLFLKAKNPAKYRVTSEQPIFVEDGADEVEFQIQVGNSKEDFTKINPFKKILKVEGGMKIDYSVGVVLKSISDDQYFLDNEKKLQRGNSDALTPGLAPMIHFYRRTCNSVGWGGTFGINADFKELTDVNLGFLGGVSVIVGRAQKIIFSAGISYSKVNRLKEKEFDVNKTAYNDTNFKIENVTERILKPSGFFSFSYNITSRKVMKP